MVKGKYIPTDGFCVKRVKSPKLFDRRSFRVKVVSKNVRVTVGCRKGRWDDKKKKCKVGTEAQRVMVRKKRGKCPKRRKR